MTLQESLTIVVQACNEARLNKQERVDVEKALQTIVVDLNAHEELKKTKHEEELKKTKVELPKTEEKKDVIKD